MFVKIYLSIIESISQRSEDYNIVQLRSIQELTKLCVLSSNHEKLIYPHLSNFILTSNNKKDEYKLQYTKAYCIEQIIEYRYYFRFF
jgi:hypothetical protein